MVKLSVHPETFSEEEPKLIPFVVYEYGKLSVSESFACYPPSTPWRPHFMAPLMFS